MMEGRHHSPFVFRDVQLVQVHGLGIPEGPGKGFPYQSDSESFCHQLENQFNAPDGVNVLGLDLVFPEDFILEFPGGLLLGGGQEHLAFQGFRGEDPVGLAFPEHGLAVQGMALGHRHQEFFLEQFPAVHGFIQVLSVDDDHIQFVVLQQIVQEHNVPLPEGQFHMGPFAAEGFEHPGQQPDSPEQGNSQPQPAHFIAEDHVQFFVELVGFFQNLPGVGV